MPEEIDPMTFSEFLDFIQSGQNYKTSETAQTLVPPSAIIGSDIARIDGPLKTTGSAMYASDYNFPRMVYAVPICAIIASGKIRSIDTSMAEKMPGVLLVLHHDNIGPLFRNGSGGRNSESRPPFEDTTVYYWGQYVAVAVAETFQQAQAAAAAVRVQYDADKFNVSTALDDPIPAVGAPGGPHVASKRGDAEAAFASAPVKIDATYITPVETHNPMEMHASVAFWDGDRVTLYETSQGVVNHRVVMAQVLGLPVENVRVVTRFLGSGFGGKLFPWPHTAMAAVAARRLGRPVKISVNRRMMFSSVGYRPRTEQRIKLGCGADGKLLALRHDYLN